MRRVYYIRMEFLPPSVTFGLCTEGPESHSPIKKQALMSLEKCSKKLSLCETFSVMEETL